jgi:hypothetical protein
MVSRRTGAAAGRDPAKAAAAILTAVDRRGDHV